ncbi:Cytochrome P450, E-class, group I [Trema orientale]|uniref:Cytochrome P450, E-class, group I n=1 Tax=Trema orientale TaxID=63057 RepID=A0A2P5EXJ8_TREOI|nr:Cytochrome P450, E-class, group I [Trema orientale]
MFSAGSDPSSTLMEWTLSEMIKNPRVMKKAQAEIRDVFRGKKTINETDIQKLDYLKLVVKETLRLHPSSPLLVPRVVREPCKIDGYDIPVNTKIIVNGWAIGRDPDYWKDAETFEPERFENSSINYNGNNFEYIPFGAGRRICPGISFALMNVEFPLAKLLYHFDWQLANGMKDENLDMTEIFGATVSRKNNLYLIPKPYAPSFEV